MDQDFLVLSQRLAAMRNLLQFGITSGRISDPETGNDLLARVERVMRQVEEEPEDTPRVDRLRTEIERLLEEAQSLLPASDIQRIFGDDVLDMD